MMSKFPNDAPKRKVIKTFKLLGFRIVRKREYIAMIKENPDGTKTPITMPNHNKIKGSTLRTISTQAGIRRDEILRCVIPICNHTCIMESLSLVCRRDVPIPISEILITI